MDSLKEVFIDTYACHYLNGAAECFFEGVAHYNDFRIGKIERSFSEIQRAWNSLWMADVKASDNGTLRPAGDTNKTFGIENFMHKDFIKKSHMNDYDLSKASNTFRKMQETGSPIRANYFLLYQLRNINQHDILEYADGACSEITDILNPYMVANFINFIRAYQEVYAKAISSCNEIDHKKMRASGVCSYKKIIKHTMLDAYVSVPTGLRRINNGTVDKYIANSYNETSKAIRDKRRNLQNVMRSIIADNHILISNKDTEQMKQWSFDLHDTPVYQKKGNPEKLSKGIEEGVQAITDSFKYSTISAIASELLGLDKTDSKDWTAAQKKNHTNLRYKIQKIKESIVEDKNFLSDKSIEKIFWRDFWGKDRYSIEFVAEIKRRLKYI